MKNPILMQLKAYQERFLKIYAGYYPVNATSLGVYEYNSNFRDFSQTALKNYLAELQTLETELETFKSEKELSLDEAMDAELLGRKIKLERKELLEFAYFERDPSLYVSEALYGLWYLWMRPLDEGDRIQSLTDRIGKIPALFAQAKEFLKEPAKVWVELALDELNGLETFLAETLKNLSRVSPSKAKLQEFGDAAAKEIKNFKKFLSTQFTKSKGEFAIGKKNFEELLNLYHGYSESVADLEKMGQKVLKETQKEITELSKKVSGNIAWKNLVAKLKKKHPAYVDLLRTYEGEVEKLKGFLVQNKIVTIPKYESLRVMDTPLFSRASVPIAAYIDPPLFSKDRTGTFFVTPPKSAKDSEALQEHCYSSLTITALHEAYPGHHLQFVYQANLKSPIRKLFNCSSYYEGWALYCEEMLGDQGYYNDEVKIFQLKDKIWRACRILVDIGLHTKKMSVDEAARFIAKETQMSLEAAKADVRWYTQRPTVPQSYLSGMLKIRVLREQAKKKWEKKYSLKKFHDWFLKFGAIPLGMIEEALNKGGGETEE